MFYGVKSTMQFTPCVHNASRDKEYPMERCRRASSKITLSTGGWPRSINIFTTVMNSSALLPPPRAHLSFHRYAISPSPCSRGVTGLPPTRNRASIDRRSASRKLVERVVSSGERDPAPANGGRGPFALKVFPALPRTPVKMRAQTWPEPSTYRIRFFVWLYGALAPNMARECAGGKE